MGVINDNVRVSVEIVDNPETSGTIPDDFSVEHRTTQITMSQETEPKERICHLLREKYPSYAGWDISEGVPYTTDDHILEEASMLCEWRLLLMLGKVSFVNELVRQLEDYTTGE
jgi:hypothetical protein